MHRWYNPNKSATPEQIADVFFDMIFNGLRSGELVALPGAEPPKAGRRKAR